MPKCSRTNRKFKIFEKNGFFNRLKNIKKHPESDSEKTFYKLYRFKRTNVN